MSYLEKTRVGRAYVVSYGKSNETSTIVTDSETSRPGGTPRQRWVDRLRRDLNRVDNTGRVEEADNNDCCKFPDKISKSHVQKKNVDTINILITITIF